MQLLVLVEMLRGGTELGLVLLLLSMFVDDPKPEVSDVLPPGPPAAHENAYPHFLRASEIGWDERIAEHSQRVEYLVNPRQYEEDLEDMEEELSLEWSAEEVRELIAGHREACAEIERGVAKGTFWVAPDDLTPELWKSARWYFHLKVLESYEHYRADDLESAVQTLMSGARAPRVAADSGNLVAIMIAAAIQGIAMQLMEGYLAHEGWNEELLALCAKEVRWCEPSDTWMKHAFRRHFVESRAVVHGFVSGNLTDVWPFSPWFGFLGEDAGPFQRYSDFLRGCYRRHRSEALDAASARRRIANLALPLSERVRKSGLKEPPDVATTLRLLVKGILAVEVFDSLIESGLEGAEKGFWWGRVHCRLGRVAVALKHYSIAEGELPESLAELVPRYLDSIPSDYDGKPVRYSAARKILYSVGWDCTEEDPDEDWSDDIRVEVRF